MKHNKGHEVENKVQVILAFKKNTFSCLLVLEYKTMKETHLQHHYLIPCPFYFKSYTNLSGIAFLKLFYQNIWYINVCRNELVVKMHTCLFPISFMNFHPYLFSLLLNNLKKAQVIHHILNIDRKVPFILYTTINNTTDSSWPYWNMESRAIWNWVILHLIVARILLQTICIF